MKEQCEYIIVRSLKIQNYSISDLGQCLSYFSKERAKIRTLRSHERAQSGIATYLGVAVSNSRLSERLADVLYLGL